MKRHYCQVKVHFENDTAVYNLMRRHLSERECYFFGESTSLCAPENPELQKRLLNAIQTDEYYSNFLSISCSRALSYHIALLKVLQTLGGFETRPMYKNNRITKALCSVLVIRQLCILATEMLHGDYSGRQMKVGLRNTNKEDMIMESQTVKRNSVFS